MQQIKEKKEHVCKYLHLMHIWLFKKKKIFQYLYVGWTHQAVDSGSCSTLHIAAQPFTKLPLTHLEAEAKLMNIDFSAQMPKFFPW